MIGESNVPGSEIEGGVRFAITAGDLLHIPAKMPHAYLTSPGDHITYVLLRFLGLAIKTESRRAKQFQQFKFRAETTLAHKFGELACSACT